MTFIIWKNDRQQFCLAILLFYPEPEMSFFLVISIQIHIFFLNIVHDSLFLTNNLTVGKREEIATEQKKERPKKYTECEHLLLHIIISYFRSFRLNKHQKPLWQEKHHHPEWYLFLPHSGILLCVAENELSTDMTGHCWHYLYMVQATMNRTDCLSFHRHVCSYPDLIYNLR